MTTDQGHLERFLNTLEGVAIAAGNKPLRIDQEVFQRYMTIMTFLTAPLFIFTYALKGEGILGRAEGEFFSFIKLAIQPI